MNTDFMQIAINEALRALKKDEVPIGACIVKDGKVIAKAHNLTEKKQIATLHAEVIAINKACAMCAGAIANARIKAVYFGAYEPKSGCAESLYPVLKANGLNHSCEFTGGIRREFCSKLLKDYFKSKRTTKNS